MLWSGDHIFPGTAETLEMLRSKGQNTTRCKCLELFSLTNTSCRQAACICDEQQHQKPRGLQEEIRQAWCSCDGGTYIGKEETLTAFNGTFGPCRLLYYFSG